MGLWSRTLAKIGQIRMTIQDAVNMTPRTFSMAHTVCGISYSLSLVSGRERVSIGLYLAYIPLPYSRFGRNGAPMSLLN